MKRTRTLLSAVLALLLVFSSVTAGALYAKGDTVAGYTVKESESHVLGDGLTFNEYTFDDANGVEQICFTMEFNPKESDFRSYVYHKSASSGYTIADDIAAAYAEGLDVYAAVNGDFFSMDSSTYGTPVGLYATEGKIMASAVGLKYPNLVIAADGTAAVVDSTLSYDLTIDGKAYTQLATVNKKGGSAENAIYYYDRDIGAQTYTAPSSFKQIVCSITDGVLGVGKTLTGTVVSVTNGASSPIGENQFVLSVGGSISLDGVEAGDKVTLAVDETVEASKEAMRNAEHIISCMYVLVRNGVDQKVKASGMSDILAQRCVFGIKPDGSIVYMVCDGRRNTSAGPNGLTFEQIVEVMTAYGCTDVINFDGGGSTAVILSEGDGKFDYEFIGEGDGRRVSNSILIVRDPDADPLPEKTYKPIVNDENDELRNVALNKPYKVTQNGIMTPKYTSSLLGDSYNIKMTDGRYRTAEDDEERYSSVFLGSNFSETYVIDLEKQRDDLRSVVFKNVVKSGNYGFKTDNVIVYVSDDGAAWSRGVDFDLFESETDVKNAWDVTCTFKEANAGRYVKLVIGSPSTGLQFDEIEVYGMVDKNEKKEEIKPEDPSTLPAEEPTEANENVALGKSYTITNGGEEIADATSKTEPRYYLAATAETTPQKLTDGKLGTSGSFSDGTILGWRAGSGVMIEVIIDLEEVKDNIEFVQLQNMINNGASFGHASSATVSYSTTGDEYTVAPARDSLSTTGSYYNLTLQFLTPFSARYVKINFETSKFLMGLGEITVCTAAENEVSLGDVNGDEIVDNADAAQVLRYDAHLRDLSDEEFAAADVNGDGVVDNADAAQILRYDAELITEFKS